MNDLEVSCAKYRKQIETLQKQAKEAAQVSNILTWLSTATFIILQRHR